MFRRASVRFRWASVLAMIWVVALAATIHAAPVAFGTFPNNPTHSNAAVAAAIANVPTNAGVVYDAIGQTNRTQVYSFSTLVYTGPVDVSLTLERIRHGDWMSTHSTDGGFFNFSPGELPNIPRKGNNYYMEFVVWYSMDLTNNPNTYDPAIAPFGIPNFPGPMRLLIGLGGEVYFTGDHYGDGLQKDAYYVNPVPPPGVFRITSVTTETNNIRITWQTVGGSTNFVEATAGTSGSYSNGFTTLSPVVIPQGGDLTSTNYLDVDGATNKPARFYRVRLVP